MVQPKTGILPVPGTSFKPQGLGGRTSCQRWLGAPRIGTASRPEGVLLTMMKELVNRKM